MRTFQGRSHLDNCPQAHRNTRCTRTIVRVCRRTSGRSSPPSHPKLPRQTHLAQLPPSIAVQMCSMCTPTPGTRRTSIQRLVSHQGSAKKVHIRIYAYFLRFFVANLSRHSRNAACRSNASRNDSCVGYASTVFPLAPAPKVNPTNVSPAPQTKSPPLPHS